MRNKLLTKSAGLLLAFLMIGFASNAQTGNWWEKIEWSFSVEKIDDSHAYVVGTGKLVEHWHVYSVDHDPSKADFTGVPTEFRFIDSPNYKTIGKLKDGIKPKTHEDELGTHLFFEHKAVFKQKIEVLTDKDFDIEFGYTFQVCDENGCLFPPEQEGKVKVSGFLKDGASTDVEPSEGDPEEQVDQEEGDPEESNAAEGDEASDEGDEEADDKADNKEKKKEKEGEATGLWGIFFLSFAGGFVALLTPCVFPMIPMTVTFFTKQSKSRAKGITNALIYGASIIIIYVILGLLVTALMGPTGLNELSTNVYMNIFFFLIFMVFAISFLGAFEIRMPNSWVNKADSKADKGGIIGIFFMAFVLGLVSFSCTGPIIGTLLVEASNSGSILGPAIGMVGFSTALAIPFTLFAIFPGWLNSLPQSGGWLNSVKVILGLLEIALALKFLSMVDLAYHWDFLTREIFVALWVVLFFTMGIYLLGLIRFAHDSVVERLTVTRYFFAMFALGFAIYLLPGMWGAPLSMIDGVAPPRTHSEDNFKFVRGSGHGGSVVADPLFDEYRSEMHEVGDGSILVFHDLDKAREYAVKTNKPLMLDFTGHACANCRKTESTVWTNDEINPILTKELVIASLYCDDREMLPESEWYYSEAIKGKVKTVGNKWSDYQVKKYGKNAQPLYVIQDHEGNDLTEAIGYTPDIKEYKDFLRGGIDAFKKK
jgi:thiol:disulfide interchange protein DsbD